MATCTHKTWFYNSLVENTYILYSEYVFIQTNKKCIRIMYSNNFGTISSTSSLSKWEHTIVKNCIIGQIFQIKVNTYSLEYKTYRFKFKIVFAKILTIFRVKKWYFFRLTKIQKNSKNRKDRKHVSRTVQLFRLLDFIDYFTCLNIHRLNRLILVKLNRLGNKSVI